MRVTEVRDMDELGNVTAEKANEFAVWMLDALIDLSGKVPDERQIELCVAIVSLAEQFGLEKQLLGAVRTALDVERLVLEAKRAHERSG